MVNKAYSIERKEKKLAELNQNFHQQSSDNNNVKRFSTFLPSSSSSSTSSNSSNPSISKIDNDNHHQFDNKINNSDVVDHSFHKTITIDPYPKPKSRFNQNVTMVFDGGKSPYSCCKNNNIKCTTGQRHCLEHEKDVTINEIGRFQYILQMDREMGTSNYLDQMHSTTSTTLSDRSIMDNMNIWRTSSNTSNQTSNNSKILSWLHEKLSVPRLNLWQILIWLIIFLLSCIVLTSVIFMFANGNKQINTFEDNYLISNYSDHRSIINNLNDREENDYDINDDIININTEVLKNDFDYSTTTDNLIANTNFPTTIEESTTLKSFQKQERLILRPVYTPIIGFTSGHQNNFGVPIEEDARILNLLNEKIIEREYNDGSNNTKSMINTTTESILAVKVSPTIPQAITKTITEFAPSSNVDLGFCVSTSLNICQGILPYDLTTIKSKRKLDSIEMEHFQYLFQSQCSKRAAEFVCFVLEPECLQKTLQPCKRICKSILEPCASTIASSEILTTIFDCDQYPDSNDRDVCEDPTRRGQCLADEFKCSDTSCIPKQWQCDNIKDCSNGEDEENCKFCDHEEFRCKTTHECISEKYICDDFTDCSDGSDEDDCYHPEEELEEDYPRIYSFASILFPHSSNNKSAFTIFDYDREDNYTERIPDSSDIIVENIEASNETLLKNDSETTSSDEIQKGEESGRVVVKIPKNLANFQESKEIMMTSDSENDFKYSPATTTTKENLPALCPENQLRCVSGKCISVDQLCDKITDCPDGADETMCVYKN